MKMTTPTIDEQIAWQKSRVAEAERYKDASVIDEQAILATLQSIKGAGDDVVEPVRVDWTHEAMEIKDDGEYVTIESYDTILAKCKQACVARDEYRDNGQRLLEAADGWKLRAEKAEAERDEFRKDAAYTIKAEFLMMNPPKFSGFVVLSGWKVVATLTMDQVIAAIDQARGK